MYRTEIKLVLAGVMSALEENTKHTVFWTQIVAIYGGGLGLVHWPARYSNDGATAFNRTTAWMKD